MAIIKYSDYNKLTKSQNLNIPKYSDYYSTSIPSSTTNSSKDEIKSLESNLETAQKKLGQTQTNLVNTRIKLGNEMLKQQGIEGVIPTKEEAERVNNNTRNPNVFATTRETLENSAMPSAVDRQEIARETARKVNEIPEVKELINETNNAISDRNKALYELNKAEVENANVTTYDKTIGRAIEGAKNNLSAFSRNKTVILDENGNKQYLPTKSEMWNSKVSNSYESGFGKIAGDIIYQGSKIGSSTALNAIIPGAGTGLYWTSMYSDSYYGAKQDGVDDTSAAIYATLNTAAEYFVGKALGSATKGLTGGESSEVSKAIKKGLSSFIGNERVLDILANVGSEGAEEFVQEFIDELNKKATLEKEKDPVEYLKVFINGDTWKNAFYSAFVGGVTGGMLGGKVDLDETSINLNNTESTSTQNSNLQEQNTQNSTNTNVSEEVASNAPKNVSENISQDTQAQIDASNAVLEELKSRREKVTQKSQQERLDSQISNLQEQIEELNQNTKRLENSALSNNASENTNIDAESLNKLTQSEQQELDTLKDLPFELDEQQEKRLQYLEEKQNGNIKFADLNREVTFKDINKEYSKYKDLSDFDNSVLNKAKNIVPDYRNTGRRTKAEWLNVAKLIGNNLNTNSSEELTKYAIQSWFASKPNTKETLNRQGNKYVKFGIEEWVNSVYEGAGVGNTIYNSINTGNELPLPKMSESNIPIQQYLLNKYENVKDIFKNETNNFDNVVKIDNKIYDISNKSANEIYHIATDIFNNSHNTNEFVNDGNKILVTNSDIKESINKIYNDRLQSKYLQEHLNVFSDLGDIIENSRLVNQTLENKGRTKYNTWNYYYNGLQIGNSLFNLEFDVVSRADGENHYRLQRLEKADAQSALPIKGEADFGASASYVSNSTTNNQNSQISGVLPTNNMQQSNNNITKKNNNNTKDIMPLSRNSDMVIKASAEKIASQLNNSKQRSWVETSTESDVLKDKVLIKDLDVNKINYMPQSNQKSLNLANSKLERLGYDNAINEVRNMMDSDKLPRAEDVALAERLLQEAARRGDSKLAQELVMDISIMGTDLGQATQALSIIQKLTPEGQLKMYETLVKRAKARGETSFENVQITPEMVEKILKVYKSDGTFEQADLNNAVEEFKQDIANQLKTTTGEKIDAWRYLAMLGNPKTHIRNVVSNVAMNGTIKVKNAMARTLETVLPIKDRTKTWKKSSDFVKDFSKTTANEMKSVITGEAKYNEKTSIESKKEIFKNKTLEKISNFNSNALEAEDWFFSKRAFQSTLEEYLTANNITTEADIKNNPEIVQKGINYSVEQAEIATFRQYSKLASSINQFERNHKALGYAIKATVPFKKTPINVAKAGAKYSPLGLIKNVSYDVYQLKQGNISASQFVDNLSQGLTGTSLTLLGYALAKAGFLKGAGDDDKEGKYDSQLGDSEYSIKIGGNSYSLSWLSPVAMPLFVGTNIFEQLEEQKEWDANIIVDTLAKTFDPLNEMSFLQSLTNVLTSYSSGTQKLAGMGESMVQNYTSQFFPTLFGQIASVFDDKKRSTKVSKNSPYRFGEQTVRSIMYKLPGLRNKLEVATDIWGNEKEQSSNIIERAFESFIAPYSKSKDITTELDKELKKVYNETDETGVIPGIPYAYINYGNNTYRMSASEYTQYKKTYGQTAYKLLNKTIQSKNYESLSYEEKAKVLKNVFGYSKYVANKEYFDSQNVDYTSKEYEKPYLYSKVGNISDYYLSKVKDFKADKDANGKTISGSAKNKAINYINSLKATIPEKAILIKMYGNFTFNDYNSQIVDYVKSKNISLEEKQKILEELGFTIKDGRVYW